MNAKPESIKNVVILSGADSYPQPNPYERLKEREESEATQ